MGARRLLFCVTRARLGSRNYRKVKWNGCEVGGSGGGGVGDCFCWPLKHRGMKVVDFVLVSI